MPEQTRQKENETSKHSGENRTVKITLKISMQGTDWEKALDFKWDEKDKEIEKNTVKEGRYWGWGGKGREIKGTLGVMNKHSERNQVEPISFLSVVLFFFHLIPLIINTVTSYSQGYSGAAYI